MILCHKCSGLLAASTNESIEGLLGCQCISGYVRGFESEHTRKQAIACQIEQQWRWINLYERQGRNQSVDSLLAKIIRLEELVRNEGDSL